MGYAKKYALDFELKYREFNPAHTVQNLYSAMHENYYGKEEFNNNEFSDGVWGIYDKPFFEFFYKQLNKKNYWGIN